MNEIYPLWVAAHGIMIVMPVNWYQTCSPLKLMIDRLVCADGVRGNGNQLVVKVARDFIRNPNRDNLQCG